MKTGKSGILPYGGLLQFDPEPAPFAFAGFDPGPAAEAFHAFLHDGQTDAGARVGLDSVQPFKDPENTPVKFRGDANAVVLDPDANELPIFLRADRSEERRVGKEELD